jgi:hypothetical protein
VVGVEDGLEALRLSQFACVLKKPIDPDDLVDAVQKCVRR